MQHKRLGNFSHLSYRLVANSAAVLLSVPTVILVSAQRLPCSTTASSNSQHRNTVATAAPPVSRQSGVGGRRVPWDRARHGRSRPVTAVTHRRDVM